MTSDVADGAAWDVCHLCHCTGEVNAVRCGARECRVYICSECIADWLEYGAKCTICGSTFWSVTFGKMPTFRLAFETALLAIMFLMILAVDAALVFAPPAHVCARAAVRTI